jgi:long-subunit acyl-CoA synthetase (AMP-forming)
MTIATSGAEGGQPLSSTVHDFFWGHNMVIYEAFGLTESSGPITLSTPFQDGWRPGSVGKSLDGAEIKLHKETSEIIVRGPCACAGYFKDVSGLNNKLFDPQGWLHTGLTGNLDPVGFLYITGRIEPSGRIRSDTTSDGSSTNDLEDYQEGLKISDVSVVAATVFPEGVRDF